MLVYLSQLLSFLLRFLKFLIKKFMSVLPAYVCVPHACLVLEKARKGYLIDPLGVTEVNKLLIDYRNIP